MAEAHALLEVLHRAARGEFPAADGSVEVVAPASRNADAVVAFTAHHYVAARVDVAWVQAQVAADPVAMPLSPGFLSALAAKLGVPGHGLVIDALFAHSSPIRRPELNLLAVPSTAEHPRLMRSLQFREDVRAFQTPDGAGLVLLGRGVAGRLEVAFEVEEAQRGRGLGRQLLASALWLAGRAEPVFAQVAPGNAASVRAVLACGFRPIGAECGFPRKGTLTA